MSMQLSPAAPMGLEDNVYNRLLRERIIFLGTEVKDEIANAICAQLLLLAAEDPQRDIHLYINSPGGSVSAGMAIYDTMQFVENDVATVAMGLAASMGQFLLTAGAKGKRYALPHARIMMHQPSGGIGGYRVATSRSRPSRCSTPSGRWPSYRAAHRSDRRADRERLRPRPLVHRRGGRRTTASSTTSCSSASPGPERRRHGLAPAPDAGPRPETDLNTPEETPMRDMNYYIPQFVERTSYGIKDRPLQQALRGADHLPRRADRRRVGQRRHGAAADCLESMDPDRDITMYINSPGGSFTALTAIYDTMQYVKPDIQTVCMGQAASAAAVLLAAGTPGKRLALPQRPGAHPPALHRGRHGQVVTSRSRPTRSCGCARCWRRSSRGTPAGTTSRSARTSSATRS